MRQLGFWTALVWTVWFACASDSIDCAGLEPLVGAVVSICLHSLRVTAPHGTEDQPLRTWGNPEQILGRPLMPHEKRNIREQIKRARRWQRLRRHFRGAKGDSSLTTNH